MHLHVLLKTGCLKSIIYKPKTNHRMRSKFFTPFTPLTAVLLFLVCFETKGQVIYGGVFNSVTRQQIYEVKVELMDKHYVTLDSMRNNKNNRIADRTSAWFFDMKERPAHPYILRFKAEGYETQDVPVDSFTFRRREVAHFIADVYMEKAIKYKTLGEVTVRATKVKIYTKGDTVVYNADAFQLAEGSMLDALIRQLPGVELKDDGRILVNGRYVENLLLNGEDFFKSKPSVMLENLPAYAVKDVKVYEKDGETSEFLGRKTGDEELVMDVRLKKEYSVGWLANAEGAYGTSERYRARFFSLRSTPHTRFTAFANVNNMNENRQPGDNGEWTPAQLNEGVRSNKNFGVNYMVNEKDGKYKLNGSASYLHFDTDVRSQTTGVNFLPNGNTHSKEAHEQFFCQTWFNTAHTFQFTWDKVFLKLQPSFSWGRWDDRNTYLSGTFNTAPEPYAYGNLLDSLASPVIGDLMRRITINRSKTNQNNKGNRTTADFNANSSIKTGIANDNLNLYTNVRYSDYEQRWYEHYRLDYPAGSGQTDFRNKYTNDDGPIRNLNFNAGGEYWLWFPCNLAVAPGYNYHWHDHTKRYELYRLDELTGWEEDGDHPLGMLPSETELLQQTLDSPNSYRSYLTDYSHRGSLYAQWGGRPRASGYGTWWFVEARLPLMYVWQTLDYRRERLDTTVSRRHIMFEPSFRVYGRWHNYQRGVDIRYNKSVSFPSMTSYIDIRSTDDPLNIRLSNTGLRNSHQHNISVYYYLNSNRKQRYFNTYWSYSITQDAVAQGYVYDKETGVRTYRPENVNGTYNIGGNVNYSMPLDKARRLSLTVRLQSRLYNSVDLIGVTDGKAPVRSTVQTYNSGGNLNLEYTFPHDIKLGAKARCTWNYLTSGRENFTTLNTYDYSYGLTAQAKLPWDLQFNTDLTLYSRRGYGESSMNTDDIVWNATLSKRFFKKRMTLSLDGFDILGQLSNITQTLNGQGRYETWRNVIPSYAMLRLTYNLNIKPSKQRGE